MASDDYDPALPRLIAGAIKRLNSDDDILTTIVGDTGSGKSNLALHIVEIVAAELGVELNTRQICMTKEDLANGMSELKKRRNILMYDEANVNSRDWGTKWNRDLMDIYMACRGLNAFHIWCNPSLEWIDKYFIKERIKIVIVVLNKASDRRSYAVFDRKSILDILDRNGNLQMHTLKKYVDKKAVYTGWFKAYKGPLLESYLQKKDVRMDDKIDLFKEKYGTKEYLRSGEIAQIVGMSPSYIRQALSDAKARGETFVEIHTPSGQSRYAKSELQRIKDMIFARKTGGRGAFGAIAAPQLYDTREKNGPEAED